MSSEIRNLAPKSLWNNFANINAIPRASKKEEKIIQFMIDFGRNLGLETITDPANNVIIKKPASKGMENCKTVVLQSHLDMVHQKNADTIFDFETQGIEMEIIDDWVTAKGTTLGADNGIGVAAIMSVLASTTIDHPSIEALFTVDEETGMTGAMGLEAGYLSGNILLNLDTEDDDEISIGCAGGIDITAKKEYTKTNIPPNTTAFNLTINGLQGGHSGMDIHKGLGNANKIMNRILFTCQKRLPIYISEISGGTLRNAIPRESTALVVIETKNTATFKKSISEQTTLIQKELQNQEPNLKISFVESPLPTTRIDTLSQKQLLQGLYGALNGVYTMNATIPDLVETSNNIARVTAKNGTIEIACLTRSFSESSKDDLVQSLVSTFQLANFSTKVGNSYPGWEPNTKTEILTVLNTTYTKLFKEEPNIMACHAGLECGILGQNYPNMEMISFGPTIRGAHSPDEKVNISSTQKFWNYLIEILKNTPLK